MNKTQKFLINELKDIVGNEGQLVELDFRHWPSYVFVAYKQKTLEYGWDTIWRYKNKNVNELDFPIMDFIKGTFKPLGNVMFCTTSYSPPSGTDDYIINEIPHGNSTLTATAKNGKFYLSISSSTLKEIKKSFAENPENSLFELVDN